MFDATFNLVTRVEIPVIFGTLKMIVFGLIFQHIFKHQIIVSVTETSSKMASTLSKMVNFFFFFCQNAQNFVWFGPNDFV